MSNYIFGSRERSQRVLTLGPRTVAQCARFFEGPFFMHAGAVHIEADRRVSCLRWWRLKVKTCVRSCVCELVVVRWAQQLS